MLSSRHSFIENRSSVIINLMLPMYVSHLQILHPRQKFSLTAAVLLDRYLFQQKTNKKRSMLLFPVKTIWKNRWKIAGSKHRKNAQCCRTALTFNTLSKPLNSAKSCNFYLPRKAALAQTLIWYESSMCVRVSIKSSSSWRHPLLHWTYTAAPHVTRSWWHCNAWCGARSSCLVLPGWARTRMDGQ